MEKKLAGKVALVTGGSRGIGAAIARSLADDGADVAISYTASAGKAEAVVKELTAKGVRAKAYKADQADPAQVANLVKTVAQSFGRLDILVNNAGVFVAGAVGDPSASSNRTRPAVRYQRWRRDRRGSHRRRPHAPRRPYHHHRLDRRHPRALPRHRRLLRHQGRRRRLYPRLGPRSGREGNHRQCHPARTDRHRHGFPAANWRTCFNRRPLSAALDVPRKSLPLSLSSPAPKPRTSPAQP